jgi:hypothetical protein
VTTRGIFFIVVILGFIITNTLLTIRWKKTNNEDTIRRKKIIKGYIICGIGFLIKITILLLSGSKTHII